MKSIARRSCRTVATLRLGRRRLDRRSLGRRRLGRCRGGKTQCIEVVDRIEGLRWPRVVYPSRPIHTRVVAGTRVRVPAFAASGRASGHEKFPKATPPPLRRLPRSLVQ